MRNECARVSVKVGASGRKIQESRLKWFGHIERGDENCVSQEN